jgi:hypothetical protein
VLEGRANGIDRGNRHALTSRVNSRMPARYCEAVLGSIGKE